ncbi:hypothetical protein [Kribbella antibiotica]|uniref:hypothetical protein n=1 Tax=Kribbella antibiotica TaxID=190195 RepID=UPI0014053B09|nr:hypothetical protein [Kribbella antibiotica]
MNDAAQDRIRADLIRRSRLVPATDPAPLQLPPGDASPDDSTEHISALRKERL